MSVRIRRFEAADLETVHALILRTIERNYSGVYGPNSIERFHSVHTKECIAGEAEKGFTIVALENGRIVGCGSVLGEYVGRVYIDPDFQGRGIGRTLMENLERHAAQQGVERLRLCASLPSLDFYLKMGYSIREKTFEEVGNGERLDYYEMEKTEVNG